MQNNHKAECMTPVAVESSCIYTAIYSLESLMASWQETGVATFKGVGLNTMLGPPGCIPSSDWHRDNFVKGWSGWPHCKQAS